MLFITKSMIAQIALPRNASEAGMGIGNTLGSGSFSNCHNPAQIQLDSNQFRLGTNYTNYFFTRELNQLGLSAQFRLGSGGLAFGYSILGWGTVMQHHINLAYGLELAKGFRMGIGVHYNLTDIQNENPLQQGVYPSLGFSYQYQEHFKLAFHVENPIALNWMGSKEKIPISFDLGFEAYFAESLVTRLSLLKTLNTDLRLSLGFEYGIHKKIFPRIGFSVFPLGFSGGLGIKFKYFQMDLALWYGQVIGPISQFDLSYEK